MPKPTTRKPASHPTPAGAPIETTAVPVAELAAPAPAPVLEEPAELAAPAPAPAAPDRRERLAAALRAAVLIAEPGELDTLEQWAAGTARRELEGAPAKGAPPPAPDRKGAPLVVIVGLTAAAGYLLTRKRRGRR